MYKSFDLNLYLVTDAPERCRYGLLETVRRAVAGGVSMVQYRRENSDHATMLTEVLPLRDFLRGAGVPLIINDDVELAVEIDADGIHIGQDDMPVEQARALIGPDKILGLTVTNTAEMAAVNPELVDYVGCGPVFPTISKDDAPTELGVQKWGELAATCPVPVCAIGGLNAERARAVRATGHCDGIAVVSAICAAENPEQAARELVLKTEALAAVLENLREKKPLILSLTNSVVQNFTANMLLAVGASPVMLDDAEECSQLLEVCGGGLLVNVGTLSHAQAEVMRCAVNAAHAAGVPWVLDPVAVGLLGFRTEFCRELLSLRPALIRGNASEIMALAGEAAGGRGTDTTAESSAAVQAARKLALQCSCTVLVTGPVDYVTDGARLLALGNGDALMTRVTGVGCAMGALAAACVASAPDCFTGAAACAAILGLAGERAAARCPRPGSFAASLLDELDALTAADVVGFTRVVQDSEL